LNTRGGIKLTLQLVHNGQKVAFQITIEMKKMFIDPKIKTFLSDHLDHRLMSSIVKGFKNLIGSASGL